MNAGSGTREDCTCIATKSCNSAAAASEYSLAKSDASNASVHFSGVQLQRWISDLLLSSSMLAVGAMVFGKQDNNERASGVLDPGQYGTRYKSAV